MTSKLILPALVGSLLAASAANASTSLIAIGSMSGSLFDLSTQTHGPLENGIAGNLLGGINSGFAWAGGNTFIATPDRGPNALAYNSSIDDTTSYIDRFHTINFTMLLTPAITQFMCSP